MPTLSKADAVIVLTKKLNGKCFKVLNCEDRSVKDVSTGVLSSSGKVTIVYEVDDERKELDVFVKGLPEQESQRKDIIALKVCMKEALIYNLFLNKLKTDVSFFPRCYLARSNDVIVLEDLFTKGYRNLPVLLDYDLKHCKKVIDCLSKLHAASIVFEKTNDCNLIELIPETNEESIFSTIENHVGRKRYLVGITALQNFAGKYLSSYSPKVVSTAFDYMNKVPELLIASKEFQNVLSHCDLWYNNIMFKYDEEDEVTDARLVDFQVCCYRPPSFDLQIFLYCCTDKAFRSVHYDDMLHYYYLQLKQQLLESRMDIDGILPFSKFEAMCQETLPLSLALAPQFIHFTCMPDHIMKLVLSSNDSWKTYYQVDRTDMVLRSAEECHKFKAKVIEGLEDFFDHFDS